MSWLNKVSYKSDIMLNRRFKNDEYKTKDENNIMPDKKDYQWAFPGFGTNNRGTTIPGAATESGSEESGNPRDVFPNSLTSGNTTDDIQDEGLYGEPHSREEYTGPARWERGSNTGTNLPNSSSPDTTELDLRNRGEPGQTKDYSPQEGIIDTMTKSFQERLRNNPTRKIKYRDTDIYMYN